jgi:hypothetical protein
MQRMLTWLGALCCAAGAIVIAAGLVLNYFGLDASFNFGDPAKFQFILVPFWQIGLAIAAIGIACVLFGRRRTTVAQDSRTQR